MYHNGLVIKEVEGEGWTREEGYHTVGGGEGLPIAQDQVSRLVRHTSAVFWGK